MSIFNPFSDYNSIIFASSNNNFLIHHEMEHTVQMDKLATFKYLYRVGLPSIYNAVENSYENNRYGKLVFSVDHEEFRTETDANRNS